MLDDGEPVYAMAPTKINRQDSDLALASRTKKRRAAGLHDAANLGTASVGARFAFAVIDSEAMLEIPQFAVGLNIIAQRRPTGGNGVVENRANGHHQPLGTAPWNAGRLAPRRHAGPPKRLRHIDIAEASDDPLVEQRRLDRRRPPNQCFCQGRCVEPIAEWLRP